MRIGILQTDSVMEQFQSEFGNYPAMFHSLLQGEGVTFADYDVEHRQYPDSPEECDAWLITGSKRSVYEDEAWIARLKEYVVELHETKRKLIGVCFGHQLIADALGGKTEPASVGWRVGIIPNQVIRQEAFMTPETPEFNLIFSHKDQVTRLPDDAVLLATSSGCPNAMYRVGDHILTVQGHPEFCKDYSRTLIEFRQDILGRERYDSGLASLAINTDEATVSRWILNFIGEPRC